MRALEISVSCPVNPKRMAILDDRHRVSMNQETYYFSGEAAMMRFVKSPLRYAGKLRDPVTQLRFRPTARSPHVRYQGRDFYFASDETRRAFEAAPESLSLPPE